MTDTIDKAYFHLRSRLVPTIGHERINISVLTNQSIQGSYLWIDQALNQHDGKAVDPPRLIIVDGFTEVVENGVIGVGVFTTLNA